MHPDSPLPTHRLPPATLIAQSRDAQTHPVTFESAAVEVMTDLTSVKAATTSPSTSLRQAEQTMIYLGVRMLFVVGTMPVIEGLVDVNDLHGERQMRLVQQRNLRYDELRVADVMTELSMLDAVDYDAMKTATVSNVIATLRRHGRAHLLVADAVPGQAARRVRGVISRTQVERQLGMPIPMTEVAATLYDVVKMLA
jgi:hypothetical protein